MQTESRTRCEQAVEDVNEHPSDAELASLIDAGISSQERGFMLQHLARCGRCRAAVSMVLKSQVTLPDPEEILRLHFR